MQTPPPASPSAPSRFQQVILGVGLAAAILFVIGSLIVVGILSFRALGLVDSGKADPLQLRLLLSSTALFIAVAFASLGFGLFLIGAEGSFRLQGGQGSRIPLLETTAPGLVVLVCATVVVYLALRVSFQTDTSGPVPGSKTAGGKVSVVTPPVTLPPIDFGPGDAVLDGGHL